MATIQILSDLHLESPKAYDIFEIVPKAPYLALLGDIGNVVSHKEQCLNFLTRQLEQFRAVLFVPGNHESYGSTWATTIDVLREFEQDITERRAVGGSDQRLGRFVVLDRGAFKLPTDDGQHIVLLGCSLFSHIPPHREMAVEMGLQDFYQTTSWTVHTHNEAHGRDLAWLNDQVRQLEHADEDIKIAILTHWNPTTEPRSTDPKHLASPIMSGFATDLSGQPCFTSGRVVLWAFGHTHYNCDFTLERRDAPPLRIMTNQRGYYFAQSEGFDEERVVVL